MLVLVKSALDTPEGKRGVTIARSLGADLALLQNAVFFSQDSLIDAFPAAIHLLGEDMQMRGLATDQLPSSCRIISYGGLVDLLAAHEQVTGVF
ncbi:MAG TPA: DsrH/TusB family sulfur metabolism protein [Dissulfurispiraceae bacterium]|nr:DsrH/TusB family sulfur metabolism protein [Dissulfurispiraceae bacterium]